MLYNHVINELDKNKEVFKSFLSEVPKEMYLWKPAHEKWCLLEMVCHLYDEEREDFRARVKYVLETPHLPLPSIDPVALVISRKYMEQDYNAMLQKFLSEREQSILWLNSLASPKWDNAYQHQKFGPISANMLFTNWVAHDYLHIRQGVRIKYEYLKHVSGEKLDYAGEW